MVEVQGYSSLGRRQPVPPRDAKQREDKRVGTCRRGWLGSSAFQVKPPTDLYENPPPPHTKIPTTIRNSAAKDGNHTHQIGSPAFFPNQNQGRKFFWAILFRKTAGA